MEKNQLKRKDYDVKAKKIENYVFKYEDLLGKGNFGQAYRGFDTVSGKQVAVKVIKMKSIKSNITRKLLDNEISILKNLKEHPNILKCCNVFTSVNNCYIITELCQRDLQKELKKRGKFTEDDIKLIIYGVYKGLEQLAKNNIIHRDIKVANIFLSKNGIPKIADFGFAINANNTFKDANIGSPIYMSPQGLLYHEYSPKTDVWSFGVLIYELLFGVTPLQKCITEKQLKTKILQPPPFPYEISSQLKQLINVCMTVDPLKRPNIFQVGDLPYFKEILIQTPKKPILLRSSSKLSTECSIKEGEFDKNEYFFKTALSYQNGLSLLHYCRLVNKVNRKFIRSRILQQFLLNLSSSLLEANFSTTTTCNQQVEKLKRIYLDYDMKYRECYSDMKMIFKPREVLGEITKLIQHTKSKICLQALQYLDVETKVLIYALQHQNPDIFTKNTEAKSLIDQGKLCL